MQAHRCHGYAAKRSLGWRRNRFERYPPENSLGAWTVEKPMLKLSEEELGQAYYRASQIVEQQTDTAFSQSAKQDYEAYLTAAEEVGIPRQAMLQALRERFLIPMEAVKPGDLIFAPAGDRQWHAAQILRVENDTSIIVQFLNGGEQSIALTDIRPLGLVPGREVEFDYQVVVPEMQGIWHKGKVAEYDPVNKQARITYGLTAYTVPLTRLRLRAEKQALPLSVRALLFRAVLIAGSIGGGIGLLLGHFLR